MEKHIFAGNQYDKCKTELKKTIIIVEDIFSLYTFAQKLETEGS